MISEVYGSCVEGMSWGYVRLRFYLVISNYDLTLPFNSFQKPKDHVASQILKEFLLMYRAVYRLPAPEIGANHLPITSLPTDAITPECSLL